MQTWLGLETWMWFAIEAAIVAVIVVASIVALKMRSGSHERRTQRLHNTFGPEYDRTVGEQGRGKAEDALDERAKRAESLDVRQLSATEGLHFQQEWAAIQSRFVDDPGEAVTRADRLVIDVLLARGYPAGNFDIAADAVSVDHPRVVIDYRAAHDVIETNTRGSASTEDLRLAMTKYRSIFTELLDVRTAPNGREPAVTR